MTLDQTENGQNVSLCRSIVQCKIILAMNITNLHFYVPIIEDIQKPKLIPDLMPFSPSAFQLYASIFIGGFTGLNVGAVLGFSAILLPQLPREITLSDKSWLASICNLGQLVGALLAGFISNKIGRKHCLLLFTIPLICGWLTLIFNHENVILANLGRTLQGFGMMPSIG